MLNDELLLEYLKERGLSSQDRNKFTKEFMCLSEKERSDLIFEMVGHKIYHTNPVDMKTFIYDPYFLGTVYGDILFKIWKDLLLEIYPAPFCKRYIEVVLSCATRAGKTTCLVISMLYEIYLLLCMINPARTLTGKTSGRLVIALLSKDVPTAVSQLGGDLHKALSLSPYFQTAINKKLSFSKIEGEGLDLTDNILIKAGGSIGTVTGTDLYAGCLDEANMPTNKIAMENLVETRTKIYKEMVDRKSATLSKAPAMSGILWLTSSPTDEGDVLGERITEVNENAIPHVLMKDNISRWEAREENKKDTFEFFLGSDTKDPCVLEQVDIDRSSLEEERIIKIPRIPEYWLNFTTNPYVAIQNIAGRRTMPESSFFNSVSMFEEVFCKDNDIFAKDDLRITLKNANDIEKFMSNPKYFSNPRKPECYRYIHLDIASSGDRFGLSSVYSDKVEYTSEEGERISRRKYFVDFCLGVSSPSKDRVDILKVLEFIYNLKGKGYPIKIVTTDNHQGELARQIIAKHGIETEYLSVEKSKDPYLVLKNLILTRSLEGFKNPILFKELRGLREYANKIDKGKGFTNDLADSLAGAVYRCSCDKYFKRVGETINKIIDITNSNSFDILNIQNQINNSGYNQFNINRLGTGY